MSWYSFANIQNIKWHENIIKQKRKMKKIEKNIYIGFQTLSFSDEKLVLDNKNHLEINLLLIFVQVDILVSIKL